MVWHSDNKSTNGLVWHVADNKAWAHIDAMWLDFVRFVMLYWDLLQRE